MLPFESPSVRALDGSRAIQRTSPMRNGYWFNDRAHPAGPPSLRWGLGKRGNRKEGGHRTMRARFERVWLQDGLCAIALERIQSSRSAVRRLIGLRHGGWWCMLSFRLKD